ncbi:MAG: helix-turn-helix transcriptional regulator [Geobacteraceae bacterium]|nr:helix-turn-helix transcriptional regulator [Geobacteraceae bacterium]
MNERLKAVRLNRGLSQKEISETLEIGLRSWQQYEQGTSIPGGKVLEALLDKLNVNINWLLSGTGKMYFKEADVDYDRDLLSQTISTLENCLAKKDLMLDSAKKAKVAVKLFENLKRSGVQAENLAMIEREAMELLELV